MTQKLAERLSKQASSDKNIDPPLTTQTSEAKKSLIKAPEFTNCSTCGIEFGKILDKPKIWYLYSIYNIFSSITDFLKK